MNLGHILADAAHKWGDRPAITSKQGDISFRRLHTETNRLAHGLRHRLGITPGDRVVVLLDNCPEAAMSYHAIVKAGAIAIPCNTGQTSSEIEFLLGDSGAQALITSTDLLPKIEPIRSAPGGSMSVICIDGQPPTTVSWSACIDGMPEDDVPPTRQPDDVALIVYTSGTTGRPKGAMLSHRGYLSNLASIHHAIPFYPSDNVLMVLPHFHVFPLTLGLFYAFQEGSHVVLLKLGKSFEKLAQIMGEHQITILPAVPPMFHILAHRRIPDVETRLSHLRMGISGGATLPPETLQGFERKFGAPLLDAYGMTEGGPLICINRVGAPRKPNSAGFPIPGVDVRIIDEAGQVLPPNEIGEIAVKSPGVMKGYYRQPEATQKVLRRGWLLTGDVGTFDADGYLYLLDRKKDVIMVQGVNVYPKEVENVLCRHPNVAEAAVIGEARGGSEVPVALVTLRAGTAVSAREILRHCRQHLAPYKVPRRVHIVAELPKSPLGKVRKQELRELLTASHD